MTTYFSTKKHTPLPTGVPINDVLTKVIARVNALADTARTLSETHPEDDNKAAGEILLKCKQGLFGALSRNNTQTIQASTPASTTVAPTPTDTSVKVAPR